MVEEEPFAVFWGVLELLAFFSQYGRLTMFFSYDSELLQCNYDFIMTALFNFLERVLFLKLDEPKLCSL